LDVGHHVQQEKQGKNVGSNEHRVCNATSLLMLQDSNHISVRGA